MSTVNTNIGSSNGGFDGTSISSGGVSQAEFLAAKPKVEYLIRTEADFAIYGDDIGTGYQLKDGTYTGDSDTGPIVVTKPIYHAKTSPNFGNINITWFNKGFWLYQPSAGPSAGPMFQNNPDGGQHSGFIAREAIFFGDGVSQFMDLHDFSSGIGLFFVTIDNFGGYTLKNMPDILLETQRIINPINYAHFVDCGLIKISGDVNRIITAIPSVYKFSGDNEALLISNGISIISNPTTKIFDISPTFNGNPQLTIYKPEYSGGGFQYGRLYTTDKTGIGTAADNGAGGVRINDAIVHTLITGDSLCVGGANDYRYNVGGYFVKTIDPNNFDLLLDYGIANVTDGGGGLLDVTTDLKHRLTDGDSIIITNTTSYNNTYTVSGVSPLTPYSFQITGAYVADESGNYELPTPFTTAGDNLQWDTGSLNESTPTVTSFLNGDEINSNVLLTYSLTSGISTAITATWTPIIITAIEQGTGNQRLTVFDDGRVFSDSPKPVILDVKSQIFGSKSGGVAFDLEFSYLVEGETTPRVDVSIISDSWTDKAKGKDINSFLRLNQGEYYQLAARSISGPTNITLGNSSSNVKGYV